MQNEDVELLDKIVIDALLNCFQPIYERAIKEQKWFRHEKKDHWFSPNMLKALIEKGRCDTLMGWSLQYPQDALEQLNGEIYRLIERRERIAGEIIAGKF